MRRLVKVRDAGKVLALAPRESLADYDDGNLGCVLGSLLHVQGKQADSYHFACICLVYTLRTTGEKKILQCT
jgi:hypothetical protein